MGDKLQVMDSSTLRAVLTTHMPVVVSLIPAWQDWLLPVVSREIDGVVAENNPPIELADALDDIGQFGQRLAADIMAARDRRGLPLPPGPDDPPDAT